MAREAETVGETPEEKGFWAKVKRWFNDMLLSWRVWCGKGGLCAWDVRCMLARSRRSLEKEDRKRRAELIAKASRMAWIGRLTGEDPDDLLMRLGRRKREEAKRGLRSKLTRMSDEQIEAQIDKAEKAADRAKSPNKVMAALLHWLRQGGLLLPQDAVRAEQALKMAEDLGLDPTAYKSPVEMLDAHNDYSDEDEKTPVAGQPGRANEKPSSGSVPEAHVGGSSSKSNDSKQASAKVAKNTQSVKS